MQIGVNDIYFKNKMACALKQAIYVEKKLAGLLYMGNTNLSPTKKAINGNR